MEQQLNEDLAVWFGKKKKPKGSSQPKGPWVNICSKDKNGKHPPCGRSDTDKGAYPKCRAAGVAGKMKDLGVLCSFLSGSDSSDSAYLGSLKRNI